jgi:ferredoxin--NADP+ reductase
VQVSGPNGKRFLLPLDKNAHDYLFIATGTGIAPFRGMVIELLDNPAGPCERQIHLVMGSPYTTDLLYDDLFVDRAKRFSNFHYHTAISREPRAGSKRGIYVDSLIDEKMETFRSLIESPTTVIYMCGLIGMQFGMYQVLRKHGLDTGYMSIKDELAGVEPGQWQRDQMRRYIKPTDRMMLEVY